MNALLLVAEQRSQQNLGPCNHFLTSLGVLKGVSFTGKRFAWLKSNH
jgi:hypothetical protein